MYFTNPVQAPLKQNKSTRFHECSWCRRWDLLALSLSLADTPGWRRKTHCVFLATHSTRSSPTRFTLHFAAQYALLAQKKELIAPSFWCRRWDIYLLPGWQTLPRVWCRLICGTGFLRRHAPPVQVPHIHNKSTRFHECSWCRRWDLNPHVVANNGF